MDSLGSHERYWIEITDRRDLGADLNAPMLNEAGNSQWSYELVREPNEGDVVFHFAKSHGAFVAYSFVVGEAWTDDVVWGAHGTSARGRDIQPYARPGIRRGLRGFTRIEPVTLEHVRAAESEVFRVRDDLHYAVGEPLYFPFVPYRGRPLRPFQGYFVKLPSALLAVLGLPLVATDGVQIADDRPSDLIAQSGVEYRIADEGVAVASVDPMERDPALVERALRSHRSTQNSLADYVSWAGLEPLSPGRGDPDWDVAWASPAGFFVVEVKSISAANEERQLRLAVGQVLRYRQRLTLVHDVVAPIIAVSQEPVDRTWDDLCRVLGIVLVWPAIFNERLQLRAAGAT